MDQTFQRIHGSVKAGRKHRHLVLRHRLQDIVCGVLTGSGSTDSNFHTDELRSPQCFDDRFDSVMPARPAALLDTQPPGLQIEIVMNENQIVRLDFKLAHQAFERGTCEIHPVQ